MKIQRRLYVKLEVCTSTNSQIGLLTFIHLPLIHTHTHTPSHPHTLKYSSFRKNPTIRSCHDSSSFYKPHYLFLRKRLLMSSRRLLKPLEVLPMLDWGKKAVKYKRTGDFTGKIAYLTEIICPSGKLWSYTKL